MAAGWDGRAHLSKALWIGLAVDERGGEVGEAFAVMRLDFASVVGLLGWRPVQQPPTLLCLSRCTLDALVGRIAAGGATLRSLDRHVTCV